MYIVLYDFSCALPSPLYHYIISRTPFASHPTKPKSSPTERIRNRPSANTNTLQTCRLEAQVGSLVLIGRCSADAFVSVCLAGWLECITGWLPRALS